MGVDKAMDRGGATEQQQGRDSLAPGLSWGGSVLCADQRVHVNAGETRRWLGRDLSCLFSNCSPHPSTSPPSPHFPASLAAEGPHPVWSVVCKWRHEGSFWGSWLRGTNSAASSLTFSLPPTGTQMLEMQLSKVPRGHKHLGAMVDQTARGGWAQQTLQLLASPGLPLSRLLLGGKINPSFV